MARGRMLGRAPSPCGIPKDPATIGRMDGEQYEEWEEIKLHGRLVALD